MPKVKGTGGGIAKIDINMTPMIDVVFQLLTFFLMTFKVASPEGDFNLKLPKEERSAGPANTQTDMLTVRLTAKPNGDLNLIQLAQKAPYPGGPRGFQMLHTEVALMVNKARESGQDEPEIQIDADDFLRYENIIKTVSAVSGQANPDGSIVPLVKKIKFAPR
jgi:biopolymer transport protein ExbD